MKLMSNFSGRFKKREETREKEKILEREGMKEGANVAGGREGQFEFKFKSGNYLNV